MVETVLIMWISGDAEVAAPSRSSLLEPYMRSIFSNLGNEVLLPPLRGARLRYGEDD